MNAHPAIDRLEALKRSLQAARDTKHNIPESIRELHEPHIQGLNAGLQIAINAIDRELGFALTGQAAAEAA
jgi:soluble cytochrome b562